MWQTSIISAVAGAVLAVVVLLLLSGCKTKTVRSYYTDSYLQAQQIHQGTTDSLIQQQGVRAFIDTLGDLKQPDLRRKIDQLYADDVYFNDTFKTITSHQELVDYLTETGEMVQYSTVELLGSSTSEDDVFIRWVLDFGAKAGSKEIESKSIGISHIRFNTDGEIILHQDFWDGADGFYSHLPIIGGLVHRVREKL